jgi:hypothetical protein
MNPGLSRGLGRKYFPSFTSLPACASYVVQTLKIHRNGEIVDGTLGLFNETSLGFNSQLAKCQISTVNLCSIKFVLFRENGW